MKAETFAALWLLAILHSFPAWSSGASGEAISKPGIFTSKPGEVCTAALKVSPQGGFKQLFLGRDRDHLSHIADDVTAILWVSPNSLVYSVSPIYGHPGIFLVTCDSDHKVSTLVAPEHKDAGYPEGSDYFEVQSIGGLEVRYHYGADVEKIDFAHWHSSKNVRTVRLPTG